MRTHLSGVLWIHSMPGPLQPHITWALARLCMPDGRKPGREIWRALKQPGQPHQPGQPNQPASGGETLLCAEVPFVAEHDSVVTLVDTLARWPRLYFELAHDPAVDADGLAIDGMRYCHTPQLGTFAGQTDAAGNIVVNEDALRSIVARGGDIAGALDAAVGGPWDRALEPMRLVTAGYDPQDCFPTPAATVPVASAHAEADAGGEAANVRQLYPRRAVM